LDRFADVIAAHEASIHFDIAPFLDDEWTGIPTVAAHLARAFLQTIPDATEFFLDDRKVARAAVIEALRHSTGRLLKRDYVEGSANEGPLDIYTREGPTVGFFPSAKRVYDCFDLEFSIVHDLSPLVTPEFHTVDNIRHHLDHLLPSLLSNAVTFCCSRATCDDLRQYLGIPEEALAIIYNGVSLPEEYRSRFASEPHTKGEIPYIVVLGTRERRKNLQRIYEMIAKFPDVLDRYRIIFVGGNIYGEEVQIPTAVKRAIASKRVHFTGFVSEYEKYRLLRGACASIYPSLFEGFGLPVLESLAVGTPCLLSYSSSLPEVAGDTGFYFDPLSAIDMYETLRRFEALSPEGREDLSRRCVARAETMTWRRSFDRVASEIASVIEAS
jgi:glycosyltransferase involved in cell wall biosynthesis